MIEFSHKNFIQSTLQISKDEYMEEKKIIIIFLFLSWGHTLLGMWWLNMSLHNVLEEFPLIVKILGEDR